MEDPDTEANETNDIIYNFGYAQGFENSYIDFNQFRKIMAEKNIAAEDHKDHAKNLAKGFIKGINKSERNAFN